MFRDNRNSHCGLKFKAELVDYVGKMDLIGFPDVSRTVNQAD